MNYICCLCDDVIYHISSFLPTRSVLNLSQTDKNFHQLIQHAISNNILPHLKFKLYQKSKPWQSWQSLSHFGFIFDQTEPKRIINLLKTHGCLVEVFAYRIRFNFLTFFTQIDFKRPHICLSNYTIEDFCLSLYFPQIYDNQYDTIVKIDLSLMKIIEELSIFPVKERWMYYFPPLESTGKTFTFVHENKYNFKVGILNNGHVLSLEEIKCPLANDGYKSRKIPMGTHYLIIIGQKRFSSRLGIYNLETKTFKPIKVETKLLNMCFLDSFDFHGHYFFGYCNNWYELIETESEWLAQKTRTFYFRWENYPLYCPIDGTFYLSCQN